MNSSSNGRRGMGRRAVGSYQDHMDKDAITDEVLVAEIEHRMGIDEGRDMIRAKLWPLESVPWVVLHIGPTHRIQVG